METARHQRKGEGGGQVPVRHRETENAQRHDIAGDQRRAHDAGAYIGGAAREGARAAPAFMGDPAMLDTDMIARDASGDEPAEDADEQKPPPHAKTWVQGDEPCEHG